MNSLFPLPDQPADTAFPTEAWPEGPLPPQVDRARLDALLDEAFSDPPPEHLGETHAFLAVLGGRIVAERYWRDKKAEDTYPSWSMAKSITQALYGVASGEGLIDIQSPVLAPEWNEANDPRRAIRFDHLLRMSSGLAFQEEYAPESGSDVIEMLFGAGKADTGRFAAGFPLDHPPGTFWSYSSGTTNILSRALSRAIGKSGRDFEAWMREKLFDPIGMRSPVPKFDEAGTFIGSSFCFCTARDFARFGLLYLRDGVWNGERILPEGWVDYARTPTATPEDEPLGYGAHWWLGLCGPDSFSANGFQGQYTVLVPSLDLILVRHGASPEDCKEAVWAWLSDIADCLRG